MSEFKKTRDVSTSKKLQPPRSLQGEEDAEATWDLILTRYPNAAPLLCQMETVIERAEGLLHQLRAPYTHALERSSSFQIADSEDELMGPCHIEESTEVSMISEQDSRLDSTENMTPEIDSVAECSLSDKIGEDSQDRKSNLDQQSQVIKPDASVEEEVWSTPLSSESIGKFHPDRLPDNSQIGGNSGQEETAADPVANVTESPTDSKKVEDLEVGKSASLEAWGKVVGENSNRSKSSRPAVGAKGISSGAATAKEDSVSEHARRLSSVKNGPIHQITKLNLLGKKDELMQRFAGTIATASKVLDTCTSRTIEQSEIDGNDAAEASEVRAKIDSNETKINERGERTSCSSGNFNKEVEEVDRKKDAVVESGKKTRDTAESDETVQGNGDEAGRGGGPRSAVEILEEYSKICGIPVEYKSLTPSCSLNKNVIVKCCFGGFAFEACTQGKKSGKREAAGKLLHCLAGRQIDGESMASLVPFSRKQIGEIMSLGNGSEHETAVRKLFRICMELSAPEPVYTVQQDLGIVGNRYTVKCGALGITTSGYGIRPLIAKRVAADELLRNYYESRASAN